MPKFRIKGSISTRFDYEATIEADDREEAEEMYNESIQFPFVEPGETYMIDDVEIDIDDSDININNIEDLPEEEEVESDNPRT